VSLQGADRVLGGRYRLVREIARGHGPGGAVALLLLEVSQLLLAGGRLGAIGDVVPIERFEPDAGPDPDIDELRERLAELLGPIDRYVEVFDPYEEPPSAVVFLLSDESRTITGQVLKVDGGWSVASVSPEPAQ